ncbi:hypothetical protein CUZ56_01940 [Saezia sanguinis]|uniref:Probable membrane transporter protein n=1 Tax=Saezia sanguinis TaxID=1965230 RepID=A0A433SD51_9BURK|nr:TSUP family transporter [Saezia sanguinis]RUS66660.1 hypothetical protein CUZ56_01940 [Saezia sanguinis]
MGIETIVILFFVAFGAGFLDAIAGGGGLITLPALLMAGVNPLAALATNKFQSSAATISATIAYARRGLIEFKTGWPIFCMSFLGSAIGAVLASVIPQSALQVLVPILLIIVAIYFYLSPKLSNESTRAKLSYFTFCLTMAPVLGFYDGIFGPGAGSFFMIAFVSLLGFGILRAIAYTKLGNAASNVGALLVFGVQGAIVWPVALTMAVGAFIGAQLGARFAVRFGAKVIKPLIIVVCLIMAVKLLLDPSNPITHFFLK